LKHPQPASLPALPATLSTRGEGRFPAFCPGGGSAPRQESVNSSNPGAVTPNIVGD
jgi:hypothetical protein